MSDKKHDECYEQAKNLLAELESDVARIERLEGLDGRADDAAQELRDRIREHPLEVSAKVTIEVLLGTGGPACGVTFDAEAGPHGVYVPLRGRVWWQDWFTPRVYANECLTDDIAEQLFEMWGCAYAEVG